MPPWNPYHRPGGYPKPTAKATYVPPKPTPSEALLNAAKVIALTLETAMYLCDHDPKALEQLDAAIKGYDGTDCKKVRAETTRNRLLS